MTYLNSETSKSRPNKCQTLHAIRSLPKYPLILYIFSQKVVRFIGQNTHSILNTSMYIVQYFFLAYDLFFCSPDLQTCRDFRKYNKVTTHTILLSTKILYLFKLVSLFRRMSSNDASARSPSKREQWLGPRTSTARVCLYFRWWDGIVLRDTEINRGHIRIHQKRNGIWIAGRRTYALIILFLCNLIDLVQQLSDAQL